MAKKAKELGVALETRTRLVNLVTDEKGAVVGAELVKGYVFPKEDSGTRMFVHARRGVVVAGGGFSQNVKLRMLHDPRLGPQLESTNQPGATGDAMMAAQRIGAADVQMDWIQLGPWTSPDEKGFGVCPKFVESSVGYGLMVALDVILTFATPSTFHGVAKHAIFAGVQRQRRSAPAEQGAQHL